MNTKKHKNLRIDYLSSLGYTIYQSVIGKSFDLNNVIYIGETEMKTEIYILSGFLGSGKTTLLKQLLQQEKDRNRNIAVVMNELGQVSIDSK